MARQRKTEQERLAKFHDPCEPTHCWEWNGARSSDGYGRFLLANGKVGYAHRAAYQLANGLTGLESGVIVRHTCDNPPCVNPAHLAAGTQADNMADRDKRGHTAKGERHGRSKLTEAEVRAIRHAHAAGESYASIAERYPVSLAQVRHIALGLNWRHIT